MGPAKSGSRTWKEKEHPGREDSGSDSVRKERKRIAERVLYVRCI